VLEEEGVYGDIAFGEYPLQLIPFEEDVLSMEMEGALREIHVEGDRTLLYYVARALVHLQGLWGAIPNVTAKGAAATAVVEMMRRMQREQVFAGFFLVWMNAWTHSMASFAQPSAHATALR
jgi:hypothetical protein